MIQDRPQGKTKLPKRLNKSLSPEARTSAGGRKIHWDGMGANGEGAEHCWGQGQEWGRERDGPEKMTGGKPDLKEGGGRGSR